MRRLAAATCVLVALAGVGCGGSSGPAARTGTTTDTAGLPSESALRSALLSEKDLPERWSEIDLESPAGGLCGSLPLAATPVQRVRASFGVTGTAPAILQQGVTAYRPGEATAAMGRLAKAATCDRYEVRAQDPRTGKEGTFAVTVAPLRLPAVGEERLGITLTVVGRGDVTLYGAIRDGDAISVLALTSDAPQRRFFSDLVGTAGRRLSDLGG